MTPLTEISWTAQAGIPILGLMQLVPLAGAMVLAGIKRGSIAFPFGLALGGLELGLAIHLYRVFDEGTNAFQLAERVQLLGPLSYHAAVDGIGVLFMLLTAFLTLMVALYGRVRPFEPQARFLGVVFACESALMSQFASLDLLWFTLVSVVQIGTAGHLLRAWATSAEEGPALVRFYEFMGFGLLLLLGGTLMLGWVHADATGGHWSFDVLDLAGAAVPPALGSVIFYLLFYGLAIRIPLFPLHGWLPAAAEHGTVAPALVFLLGLKTGVYGFLRFLFPLVPDAVWQWHPYVVAFAAAGIFYAALLALMQQNLRRLLAYAVVSHTSVLVIGLFSLHPQAFQGSSILAVNFGLAVAGLLFMAGFVYRRTQTMLLPKLGGLFDRLPLIGIAFLVAGLAIVGMPGTPGFDAAHLMLEAAIDRFGALVTMAAALGNVAAAAFLLWAFQRAFLAPPLPGAVTERPVRRAGPIELTLAALMIVVQLAAGFFSEPWLKLVEQSTQTLAAPYTNKGKEARR